MRFPACEFVPDRVAYIADHCRDKRVLHLGFADAIHARAAMAEGRHLHEMIMSAAEDPGAVVGVDYSEEAVERFKALWPHAVLLWGNVEKLDELNFPQSFDTIVAGELIEHLNNPGLFLESVTSLMRRGSTLMLTTPNLLSIKFAAHALFIRNDRSHYDHSLGFSISTLSTLLARYGLRIAEVRTSMEVFSSRRNAWSRRLLRWAYKSRPDLAETLIVKAQLAE